MYDFQKANMWKRISSWLFDFILIGIVIVGAASLLALAFRTTTHVDKATSTLQEIYHKYEEKYGINLNMEGCCEEHKKAYAALTEDEKTSYLEAAAKEKEAHGDKIKADPELKILYNEYMARKDIVDNLGFLIATLSVLAGFLIMEFIIPLILKNGQTLGKKIFGIGVMRVDGVRITPIQLFLRSILGKATLEALVPIYIILLILNGQMGFIGLIILIAIVIAELVLLFATKARTPIHDIMSGTVTMDYASQMVFDTPEELLAYKQKIHNDTVNSQRD